MLSLSAEAQAVAVYWKDSAPPLLSAALEAAGTFPHPELTMGDLREIIVAYEDGGAERATSVVGRLNSQAPPSAVT